MLYYLAKPRNVAAQEPVLFSVSRQRNWRNYSLKSISIVDLLIKVLKFAVFEFLPALTTTSAISLITGEERGKTKELVFVLLGYKVRIAEKAETRWNTDGSIWWLRYVGKRFFFSWFRLW